MGVGKEVARVLYSKHATVYLGCRSEAKALAAIADIEAAHPDARGRLAYQHVDLADLATIAASARAFAAREPRLHVLFNNAGLSMPPAGSVSAQGYELQLATNNLGPFLLTKLLTPTLVATARAERDQDPTTASSPVRVVWLSSSAMENFAHRPGGVPVDLLLQKGGREAFIEEVGQAAYGVTKAGNYLHSCEYARRHRADGVVSVAVNPGNLHTGIMRHLEGPLNVVVRAVASLVMYPALYGAYTELWAGLSDEVTLESSGSWSKFCSLTLVTLMPYSPRAVQMDELIISPVSRTMGSFPGPPRGSPGCYQDGARRRHGRWREVLGLV